VTTATTTTTTSSSGGVPVFPYQLSIAAVFTVLLVGSYLLVRRRIASPKAPPGQDPPGSA
jgi:hypothetical protein